MTKNYLIIMSLAVSVFGGLLTLAQAQDPFAKLTYPIAELGNCANRQSCGAYCDKSENMKACLDFAQAHNLLPQKDIEMGQRMLALGTTKGPGGCRSMNECETYCDQIEHIKECIVFAQKNNLIPPDELQEARKVVQAIDRGLTPPKCKGKKECDVYCSKLENMEECIVFGEAAGLIPPSEIAEAKMMLEAIKKGAKPPACAGKKECDIYCSGPEHMEECLEFGIVAGFMPAEEIENARRMLEAIKKGAKPPNCRGEEECNVYCSQPEHQKECINFAEAAGFMTPEDAARARKMAELGVVGGPGGCQGEEECEAFCSKPENMETCIDFSVKIGEMTPEEAEKVKQEMRQGSGSSEPTGPSQQEETASPQEFLPQPAESVELAPSLEPPSPELTPQSFLNADENFLAAIGTFLYNVFVRQDNIFAR